jgi:hypothetical protein
VERYTEVLVREFRMNVALPNPIAYSRGIYKWEGSLGNYVPHKQRLYLELRFNMREVY